jgi:hypothetical protein
MSKFPSVTLIKSKIENAFNEYDNKYYQFWINDRQAINEAVVDVQRNLEDGLSPFQAIQKVVKEIVESYSNIV